MTTGERVISELKRSPQCSVVELASHCGFSLGVTQLILNALKSEGQVELVDGRYSFCSAEPKEKIKPSAGYQIFGIDAVVNESLKVPDRIKFGPPPMEPWITVRVREKN